MGGHLPLVGDGRGGDRPPENGVRLATIAGRCQGDGEGAQEHRMRRGRAGHQLAGDTQRLLGVADRGVGRGGQQQREVVGGIGPLRPQLERGPVRRQRLGVRLRRGKHATETEVELRLRGPASTADRSSSTAIARSRPMEQRCASATSAALSVVRATRSSRACFASAVFPSRFRATAATRVDSGESG